MRGTTVTDPCGRSFLSYRRTRIDEAKLLIAAQHDLGIPTWYDLENLEAGPTDDQLRATLNAATTANAIVWLTPDVAESLVIGNIELPLIIRRERRQDGFFAVPVAAGGLGYSAAANAGAVPFMAANLAQWNQCKVAGNPIVAAEAGEIAERVLRQRLRRIHERLPRDEPLRLGLYTRRRPPHALGNAALVLDWQHRFDPGTGHRMAHAGAWDDSLLPALRTIRACVGVEAPDRPLRAFGFPGLPAATALGAAFVAPAGIDVSWEQEIPGQPAQRWSLACERTPSGFVSECWPHDRAGDLAVMVSVNAPVEPAAARVIGATPVRASVQVHRDDAIDNSFLADAGQAADLAWTIVEAMRNARTTYPDLTGGTVHLFMAVPAGVAMMVGQLLNTFGTVQTYEYIAEAKRYRPAARLTPSS